MNKTGKLKRYAVLTPLYTQYYGSYYDPAEYGCDYRVVYARNAKRAIVLAVRAWRRANKWYRQRKNVPVIFKDFKNIYKLKALTSPFVEDNLSDQVPPWKGIKATLEELYDDDT